VIILGVDPGSIRTGYGVIESNGRRHRLIEKGVFCPPRRAELPERLRFVRHSLSGLIDRIHPDIVAVEDLLHAVHVDAIDVVAQREGAQLDVGHLRLLLRRW